MVIISEREVRHGWCDDDNQWEEEPRPDDPRRISWVVWWDSLIIPSLTNKQQPDGPGETPPSSWRNQNPPHCIPFLLASHKERKKRARPFMQQSTLDIFETWYSLQHGVVFMFSKSVLTSFWDRKEQFSAKRFKLGWIICHTQLIGSGFIWVSLSILNWTSRQMAWLFVWTLLHLLSLLTTAPPLDALHLLQYILFLSQTLLTRVWRTFNGKWKELFHDACLWSEALFIMLKWEDGLRNGEREPIISAKHTPEANRAGELDTIFDIRSFWEIYRALYYTLYICIYHTPCSLITFYGLDVN